MKITPVYDKVLNACFRLNAEAFEQQFIANGQKTLKQFTPCAKAEELMSVIRSGKHFGQAEVNAAVIICPCHQGLSLQELTTYEYDETYRQAHYNHDMKTLYPRLYK